VLVTQFTHFRIYLLLFAINRDGEVAYISTGNCSIVQMCRYRVSRSFWRVLSWKQARPRDYNVQSTVSPNRLKSPGTCSYCTALALFRSSMFFYHQFVLRTTPLL